MAPMNLPFPTIRARALRRNMSLPEVSLWKALRSRPSGFKFRRQHPVDGYVLDFYCADALLAVEVDGIAHDMGDRPARDAARDLALAARSVRTLRFAARDVLGDLEAVVVQIVVECEARTSG
jgi:very-short-patch-repair endonuclease